MTTVEHSVVINQPIEKVFAYVSDVRNNPKWQTGILDSKVTPDGPARVGTQVTDVRTFIGKKIDAVSEITELEPNKRMGLKSVSGPFPFTASLTLDPAAAATKLTFHIEMEAKGAFKLAEGLVGSGLNKDVESSLHKLKEVLESQA